MQLLRRLSWLVLAATVAAPHLLAKRVVISSPDQIVRVSCRVRFTTTIVLPPQERILDFVTGDSQTWQLTGAANVAFVKPSAQDARTNVTLVVESGRIYFFLVRESSLGDPDIHVHVELPESEATEQQAAAATPPHQPMFVSRDEVEEYERAAESATARARTAWEQAESRVQKAVDSFRAEYPTLMRFEYNLEARASQNPFGITGMWHDGRFTFARTVAEEAPALYENRDGKPSLVSYDLRPDGLYIVRRVLLDGWFQVGKRRARWSRRIERKPEVGPLPPLPEPVEPEVTATAE